MFVYSVKGNTLKLAGIICLGAVLTLALLFLVPKNADDPISSGAETQPATEASAQTAPAEAVKTKEEKINYNRIKTNEDRIKFLEQFGWQVESEPLEETALKIPRTFDNVLTSYNNIQLHQGLDLSKYTDKEVMRYTYKVTNFPDYTGNVVANVIIYKNRVIGGDVCSSDVDGFIKDFSFPASQNEDAAAETELAPADSTETAEETTAQ